MIQIKKRQKKTIKQILYSNKYDTSLLNKLTPKENKKRSEKKRHTENKVGQIYIY